MIKDFVSRQLAVWPLAADNFAALEKVHVRELDVNGLAVRLQFNPARMISSAAKLDKADIAKRKCFLCEENRPDVQMKVPFAFALVAAAAGAVFASDGAVSVAESAAIALGTGGYAASTDRSDALEARYRSIDESEAIAIKSTKPSGFFILVR